ncbi:kinase-like domain-containing protein [Jimgerdemannia flammicorona]|uniref:Kinase-like domain-containing protein n=1 Tax=Jimgerdemannia flammicorona TaxID=994334 RepID=A0A433R0K0_9FUNG|nr:kinase-like domain-containing protein [Jimgerdemannia flammicorona]
MDREAILPKPDPNEFKDITSNQSPLNLREAPSKASDPGQIQDKTNDRALSPLESKFSSGEDPTLDGPKNWLQSAIKEGRIEFFDFDEEFNNPIRIAEGGFAKIYHTTGKKLKSKEYALKYLFEQPESAGAFQSLHDRINLSARWMMNTLWRDAMVYHRDLSSVNKLFSANIDPKTNSYILVMKYAEQGALPDYLKKNMGQLSWADKLSLAIQIAEALRYIHSRNVIHRDLHSKNILCHQCRGKGTHRRLWLGKVGIRQNLEIQPPRASTIPFTKFHFPWSTKIPPERLSQRAKHDTRGDVFSLGVIFWVISADGGEPFSDLDTMTTAMQINLGFREEPIQGTPEDYVELYSQCWDGDPAKRPKVDEILTRLDAMMKAVLEKEGKGDGFHNTVASLAPVVSENTLSGIRKLL